MSYTNRIRKDLSPNLIHRRYVYYAYYAVRHLQAVRVIRVMREVRKFQLKKMEKDRKKLERLEKQSLAERQKIIKPGECMKYVTVEIDSGALSTELFGTNITSVLGANHIQYKIKAQPVENTITWRRSLPQNLTGSSQNNELQLSDKSIQENFVLLLISARDLIHHIKAKTLLTYIDSIKANFPPTYTLDLIISGLTAFCRSNRGCIGRTETEFALTEMQLLANVCHRLLETPEEIATTIQQYTKSIAESPFKQQKAEKYEKENFYLGNDSKDCVRVQNGIGFSRLWQQQLIKLPNVTLEIAESIIAKYPMPSLLMTALEEAENPDELLADLNVRRAGGPMTTSRRIGPELSRKVANLFMNENPDALI